MPFDEITHCFHDRNLLDNFWGVSANSFSVLYFDPPAGASGGYFKDASGAAIEFGVYGHMEAYGDELFFLGSLNGKNVLGSVRSDLSLRYVKEISGSAYWGSLSVTDSSLFVISKYVEGGLEYDVVLVVEKTAGSLRSAKSR